MEREELDIILLGICITFAGFHTSESVFRGPCCSETYEI